MTERACVRRCLGIDGRGVVPVGAGRGHWRPGAFPFACGIPVSYAGQVWVDQRSDTVPERIYRSAKAGSLEALEETPFANEDDLQALIAEPPELIDGEQIHPGDARPSAEDASSKGVKAWAIRHETAVQHQDALVERLRNVVRELAAL